MRCYNCKSEASSPTTDVVTRFGVEVPIAGERCRSCGEVTFPAAEVQRSERAVADAIVERGIRTGAELKWVRKLAGMRAMELAEILGVTQDTVSRWETEKIQIPPTVRYVVADLYERPRKARERMAAIVRPGGFELTDEQIQQLRIEAGMHGDLAQVELCERALDGDERARAKCARVIADARAQE